MARWREKMERLFAAVSFAEEGQRGDALKVAGLEPVQADLSLESAFAAAAFAEANCHEMAREVMGLRESPEVSDPVDFASIVGLRGVRIWYGVAHLAA
ncbi:MAG: hypothetical protein WHX93_07530 [bacterium]